MMDSERLAAEDPAFAKPLPPVEFLDRAARANGFEDWFAVPTFLQTTLNRKIIVEARVLERGGHYVHAPPSRLRRA
jgi:hypothetical protein